MGFFGLLLSALAIFGLANFYIIRRGSQALAGFGLFRTAVLMIYGLLLVCFFLGRTLSRRTPGRWAEGISIAGSIYLETFLYFLLLLVLVDALRLADHFFPFFPGWIRTHGRTLAFFIVVGGTLALSVGGYLHMRHVRIKTMDLTIPKTAGKIRTLDLVLISDIHVGPFLHNARLEKIVGMVNGLKPDIVLIPGDVVNEDTLPSELEKMTATFRKIRARYGVFASTGNHEYFAGIEKSLGYLRRSGFTVLLDEAALVEDSFYVVGRLNDAYMGGRVRRKPLREILSGVDMSLPVILLDHQPAHLGNAAEAGIDLQLSGHTHGGGVFPITLINSLIYEVGSGYYRKGGTQYYVTTGVGIWEPPARIGTTAEVVLMKLTFGP